MGDEPASVDGRMEVGTGPDLRPWKAHLGASDIHSRRKQGTHATHLTFGTRQRNPKATHGACTNEGGRPQTFPASPVRDAWHDLANDACAFRLALLVWSVAGEIATRSRGSQLSDGLQTVACRVAGGE